MAQLSTDQLEALWQSARPEGQAVATGAPPAPVTGPFPVTVRPQGVVPPVGPEATGTPGATAPAVAPTVAAPEPPSRDAAPLEVRTADTSPKPAEGLTDLDVMMQGVWQVESGNQHINPKTGKITTSSTGNLGVSQLGVDTAKGLGVDPYDEKQNRAGGKRYLAQMFERYGNWRDAAGAYYAGPGNYDKWLNGGSRRDTKLGKEITAYQDKVFAYAGIAERETQPAAQRAPDGSRVLSNATLEAIFSDLPAGSPEEETRRDRRRRDREGGTFLEESTDRAQALTYGLYKGARDLMLAPAQAVMEQIAPDGAAWLTNRVKEVDAPWRPTLDRHNVLAKGGEIIGGTAALMAGMRLLGPAIGAGSTAIGITKVLKDIAPRVPWLLKTTGELTRTGRYAMAVPGGAAITTGTTFTESGDPSDRWWLAGLGAFMGPLGVSLGQGWAKIMTTPLPKSDQAAMMQALKDNAALLSVDLNALKDRAVSRIGAAEKQASAKYAQAVGTGAEVRGLNAETLNNAIRDYTTKAASQIEGTTRQLVDKLGLDKEAAKAAQATVLRQQYTDQAAAVARAQEQMVERFMPPPNPGVTAAERDALRQRVRAGLENDPGFPRMTMEPPPPYVPGVIDAETFMKGRQFLRQEARVANTRARRNQLVGLERELDKAFAEAAREAGMPAGQFYRRLREADKFYKANVVPAHDVIEGWFGRRFRGSERMAEDATNKLTQGLDGAKVYAKVMDTVENGTQREVDAMLHAFGMNTPAEKELLIRSIAHRALTKAEGGIGKDFDPLKVKKYIDDNHTNLRRVMTPEQYKWMEGFAKVTEGVMERLQNTAGDKRGVFSSRILNIFGLEHLWRGDVVRGLGLISSGMFAHTLVNNLPVLRDKVLSKLVGRMAHLKPGSAEYEEAFRRLETQWAKRVVVGARAGAQLGGAGAEQPPAFAPLRPVPAR